MCGMCLMLIQLFVLVHTEPLNQDAEIQPKAEKQQLPVLLALLAPQMQKK